MMLLAGNETAVEDAAAAEGGLELGLLPAWLVPVTGPPEMQVTTLTLGSPP